MPVGAGYPRSSQHAFHLRPTRKTLAQAAYHANINLWKIDTAHSSCGVRQPIHC